MLVPAIMYEEELKKKMRSIWFEDKYKYYIYNNYCSDIQIDKDSWNKHQFVSIDSNGNIIGYIAYEVCRQTNACERMAAINFTDNIAIFGMDLGQALKDIFEKFKFRKLNFSVVVGNPIERSYDKLIQKYNGRIVGVYKKDALLIDGEYYDKKAYEIMREDYMKAIRLRGYKEVME